MICHMPFFIASGTVEDDYLMKGSAVLAKSWGAPLIEYSTADLPENVLSSLTGRALVSLSGDPGAIHPNGMSWLEALGAWNYPVVLIAPPSLPSGAIDGSIPAYAALCAKYSLSLLGIVQIGGGWDLHSRRLDGLPWIGCLPINRIDYVENLYEDTSSELYINALEIVFIAFKLTS